MNPFGGGDPRKLMKQLQQAQQRIQEEIAALRIEATAGGGMVKVTLDGQKNMTALVLDREAVNPEDVEMLQDMILTAVNDAARQVDDAVQSKIGGLTGGLKLPGF
jgi:DNA-binding YbaB/EbfC family protein